jgi:hypothetical protein
MNLNEAFELNSIPYHNFWYYISDSTHKKTPTGGINKTDSLEMIDKKQQTFTNKKPVTYYNASSKMTQTFSETEEKTITCAYAVFLNHTEGIYCLDVDDEDINTLDEFIEKTNANYLQTVHGHQETRKVFTYTYRLRT